MTADMAVQMETTSEGRRELVLEPKSFVFWSQNHTTAHESAYDTLGTIL